MNHLIFFVALIVSLGNVDTLAVPGHVRMALTLDCRQPNAADKREVIPADPSPAPSTPSISHGAESSGTTLATLSEPLPVTVSSGNTNSSLFPRRVREPAKSSTHELNPSVASEDTSNRKPTVSATTNAILRGVEGSPNAYPPLKSTARHLYVILDKCQVRLLPYIQSTILIAIPATRGKHTNH